MPSASAYSQMVSTSLQDSMAPSSPVIRQPDGPTTPSRAAAIAARNITAIRIPSSSSISRTRFIHTPTESIHSTSPDYRKIRRIDSIDSAVSADGEHSSFRLQASDKDRVDSGYYGSVARRETSPLRSRETSPFTSRRGTEPQAYSYASTSGPFRQSRWKSNDDEDGESVILRSPPPSAEFEESFWRRDKDVRSLAQRGSETSLHSQGQRREMNEFRRHKRDLQKSIELGARREEERRSKREGGGKENKGKSRIPSLAAEQAKLAKPSSVPDFKYPSSSAMPIVPPSKRVASSSAANIKSVPIVTPKPLPPSSPLRSVTPLPLTRGESSKTIRPFEGVDTSTSTRRPSLKEYHRPNSKVYTPFMDQPPTFSDEEDESEQAKEGRTCGIFGCLRRTRSNDVERGGKVARSSEAVETDPLISSNLASKNRRVATLRSLYFLVLFVAVFLFGAIAFHLDLERMTKWKEHVGKLVEEWFGPSSGM
ncbi:hypothetical protein BT69DRAFT_1316219 [Atractiella rhizophila]|nr:hypothetical protein BT69DRAFT_1316219 [Atractiella rhizophila]